MAEDEYVGLKNIIKRAELVQIIAETLHSLGYSKSAEQLEEESEIRVSFERQILDGQWDESLETLNEIVIPDEENENLAIQAINQQRVLEVKIRGKERRSTISGLRMELLKELKMRLRPSLDPNTRLISLVEQALGLQVDSLRLHNSSEDHEGGMENIPCETLRVLHGHDDKVLFLAFSHSGEYLASSSADRSVIIWEVKTDGQVSSKLRLSEHKRPVSYVSWSPDDKHILTCGSKETVRLWDVATGCCRAVYGIGNYGFDSGLVSCAWSLDGKTIFAGSRKNYGIAEWCLNDKSDHPVESLQLKAACKDLGIAADGETVMTRFKNMVLFVEWGLYVDNGLTNMHKGSRRRIIKEDHKITSCTLSEDRKFLLVSLVNGEVHLWSIDDVLQVVPELVAMYKAPRLVTRSCLDGQEQAYVACASEDSKVYIWKRCRQELVAILEGHSGAVNCVSWNPTNPQNDLPKLTAQLIQVQVSSSGTSGGFRLLVKHRQTVTGVALSEDASRGFSASKDGTIVHWDVENGKAEKYKWPKEETLKSHNLKKPQGRATKHSKHVLALAMSCDGRYLASGGLDRHVHLWDVRTHEHLQAFPGHQGAVSCLTFRKGTPELLSGSFDGAIKIWNVEDRTYINTIFVQGKVDGEILSIDSLRKERALTVGRDHKMRLWKDPEPLEFDAGALSLECCCFISDDEFLSGSNDGSIERWSIKSGKPIHTENAHASSNNYCQGLSNGDIESSARSWVSSIAVCRNSDLAASGAGNGLVRLWEVKNQSRGIRSLFELPLTGFVNSLAFAKSAKFLIAGIGQEPRLGRWERIDNAQNGVAIHPFELS